MKVFGQMIELASICCYQHFVILQNENYQHILSNC